MTLPVNYIQNPAASHTSNATTWVPATISLTGSNCNSPIAGLLLLYSLPTFYSQHRSSQSDSYKTCQTMLQTYSKSCNDSPSLAEQKPVSWQWLTGPHKHSNHSSPACTLCFLLTGLLVPPQMHLAQDLGWHWLFLLPTKYFPRKLLG